MEIKRGKIGGALKIVLYGPEGIGKSTFASKLPDPLFIDTEDSTRFMDVARTPKPTSWTMLKDQVTYVRDNPTVCKSLIIDTADWAEVLCSSHVCSIKLPSKDKTVVNGIEDFGYGKGYTYLEEEFGRLLDLLSEVVNNGINVCFTAHAQMRKFEQPDETGAYDRWEMKLEKKTAALVKEWADIILFANYKTYVVNVDNKGAEKGKNKAQGGSRVMYTTHHPCWDAKNRHGLPDELDLDFTKIAHLFSGAAQAAPVVAPIVEPPAPVIPDNPPPAEEPAPRHNAGKQTKMDFSGIPQALRDLMKTYNITPDEIQDAVTGKGYYPKGTPIANYDPGFIQGVLIGAWKQVESIIIKKREEDAPF